MTFHFPQQLPKRCLQAITCMVLLVVGLGLSRSMVVCTQPCCHGHVKLAPSCDLAVAAAPAPAPSCCGCCGSAQGAPARGDGGGQLGPGCAGCVHIALGVELAMPPAPTLAVIGTPAAVGWAVVTAPWTDADRLAARHPPATGPPRRDHRTALLASTILRL